MRGNGWGGKRAGAGRRSLSIYEQAWIVGQVRSRLTEREPAHRRFLGAMKKYGLPGEVASLVELERRRRTLSLARNAGRDVSWHLSQVQKMFERRFMGAPRIKRQHTVPPPGTKERGRVYAEIADLATSTFGRRITRLQVERCCRTWLDMEGAISAELPIETEEERMSRIEAELVTDEELQHLLAEPENG